MMLSVDRQLGLLLVSNAFVYWLGRFTETGTGVMEWRFQVSWHEADEPMAFAPKAIIAARPRAVALPLIEAFIRDMALKNLVFEVYNTEPDTVAVNITPKGI